MSRQTPPGKVWHELAARGVTQLCLLDDFLSEATLGQVSQGPWIDEQAIAVQLGRGTQYRCSRWIMLGWWVRTGAAWSRATSEIADRRGIRVSTEALGSFPECQMFQLLDEADCVSACLAAEALKPPRARKDGEVGPTAILVGRASAHQGRARLPELNSVAGDQIGDRVIQSESFGIDPCARHGEAVLY